MFWELDVGIVRGWDCIDDVSPSFRLQFIVDMVMLKIIHVEFTHALTNHAVDEAHVNN